MSKVFVVDRYFDDFVSNFSKRLLTSENTFRADGRIPTVIYISYKEERKETVKRSYYNSLPEDFSFNLQHKESYFALFLDERISLSRIGYQYLINKVKNMADFIFIDVNIISNTSYSAVDLQNIKADGIIANIFNTSDYSYSHIANTYVFVSEYSEDVYPQKIIVDNEKCISCYYNPQFYQTERRKVKKSENVKVLGCFNDKSIDDFIEEHSPKDEIMSQEIEVVDKDKSIIGYNSKDGKIAPNYQAITGSVVTGTVATVIWSNLSLIGGLTNGTLPIHVSFAFLLVIFLFVSTIGFIAHTGNHLLGGKSPRFKRLMVHRDEHDGTHSEYIPLPIIDTSLLNIENVKIKDDKHIEKAINDQKLVKNALDSKAQWIKKIRDAYKETHDSWTAYELDISKGLEYPTLFDVSVTEVRNFYKVKKNTDRELSFDDAYLFENKKDIDNLISDFEIAFLNAEHRAIKDKLGNYTLEDQKKLRDALPIAQLAQSESASDEERETATKALLKKIDGVVVLPQRSQEILQKNLITQN